MACSVELSKKVGEHVAQGGLAGLIARHDGQVDVAQGLLLVAHVVLFPPARGVWRGRRSSWGDRGGPRGSRMRWRGRGGRGYPSSGVRGG